MLGLSPGCAGLSLWSGYLCLALVQDSRAQEGQAMQDLSWMVLLAPTAPTLFREATNRQESRAGRWRLIPDGFLG